MESYLALYAVAALALGAIAGSISEKKGRGFAVGFVSSILLTPAIGIVIALVLSPDKDHVAQMEAESKAKAEQSVAQVKPRTP